MRAEHEALVREARAVRERAYAPYSRFQVGAALRAVDGRIFAGVNVENGAYPTGLCAERAAIAAAVAAGARRFEAVAIVTAPNRHGRPAAPCGQCRQALAEFGLDLDVVLAAPDGPAEVHGLRALLPLAFSGDDL